MLVRMFIEGIRYDLIQKSPVVILRDEESHRFLPIWIGMPEAAAIQLALDKQITPRPMTHDLLANVLKESGQSVVQVTIHSIVDKVFHAQLNLKKGDGPELVIDSRPSDALAVAVRVQCPIFVSQDVLNESALDRINEKGEEAENEEEEREKFKDFIENIKPSDFMDQ